MSSTSVRMVCSDLPSCPEFPAPTLYQVRWYQPGDDRAWTRIQQAADVYNTFPPSCFRDAFGSDDVELMRRQCYICDAQGEAIATSTAWFDECCPSGERGRIHWVAVVPEYQGRGLGKVLMSVVCTRLVALGCREAYLTTSTLRITALNLYTRCGFVPDMEGADERQRWLELLENVAGDIRPSKALCEQIRADRGR